MVFLTILFLLIAALAARDGNYTMMAMFLLMPVIDVVETWGWLDRAHRTRGYWIVVGTLALAFALLITMQWIATGREAP